MCMCTPHTSQHTVQTIWDIKIDGRNCQANSLSDIYVILLYCTLTVVKWNNIFIGHSSQITLVYVGLFVIFQKLYNQEEWCVWRNWDVHISFMLSRVADSLNSLVVNVIWNEIRWDSYKIVVMLTHHHDTCITVMGNTANCYGMEHLI